jgi:uncharacterized BrkB/YihY/UPF0761 family membrane protein
LGFALVFGVAVSLWSANAGMKALFDALNVVYGEKERRGFIRLNAISLAFTLSALIFMMIALCRSAGLIPVLRTSFAVPLNPTTGTVSNVLRSKARRSGATVYSPLAGGTAA